MYSPSEKWARRPCYCYCERNRFPVPVAVKQTPLIAQYLSVKQRVPDAILFFRLGDFYEMFFEDAEVGARVLDIQLTSRNKDGVPLCGVPYHSAEPYIAKLLKAGHKVAICEQGTPDPKTPKLMPRQIVRVITPGTVGEEMVLTAAEKSYLVAVTGARGDRVHAGGARRLDRRVSCDAGARGLDAVRGNRAHRAARNRDRRARTASWARC